MEILFKKISTQEIHFDTKKDDIRFFGTAQRESKDLVLCKCQLEGSILHQCDRCGEEFTLTLNDSFELIASDGVYSKDDTLDVVEFHGGSIDFNSFLESEVEALKSDYHYCKNCTK